VRGWRKGWKHRGDCDGQGYGSLKGVMVMRNDQDATPSCTIAAAMNNDTPWMAIAIVNDTMSAGAQMISVMPRTQ